jgi:hypothetical protein
MAMVSRRARELLMRCPSRQPIRRRIRGLVDFI